MLGASHDDWQSLGSAVGPGPGTSVDPAWDEVDEVVLVEVELGCETGELCDTEAHASVKDDGAESGDTKLLQYDQVVQAPSRILVQLSSSSELRGVGNAEMHVWHFWNLSKILVYASVAAVGCGLTEQTDSCGAPFQQQ